MNQFSDLPLDPAVLTSLERIGYQHMTPIQEMAIPKLLTGQDFLGQAPTGTGKTAAFGIPLISRLQPGSQIVEALIIGPTRELVQQIADELNRIGQDKGVQALAIYGGESVFAQKEVLRTGKFQIIVGTPGRILDHIRQLTLNLTKTRMVILDEADEMLDMGFRPDIEEIFKQLPGGRETWLFSATISSDIRKIADQYMYHPEEVRIQPQETSSESIQQFYYVVKEDEKSRLLKQILKSNENLYGILFCQTKRDVVLLTRKLRDFFPLDCLHGAMQQSDRDQVMDEFRSGKLKLLISTDIMARGIDVDNLTHIINYSPPGDPESYIHRIGRTARKGETGIAITFFTPDEKRALDLLMRRVKMGLERHPDSTEEFELNPAKPDRFRRGQGRSQGGGGRGPSGLTGSSPPRFGSSGGGRSRRQPPHAPAPGGSAGRSPESQGKQNPISTPENIDHNTES